jgi:hypothetical protein
MIRDDAIPTCWGDNWPLKLPWSLKESQVTCGARGFSEPGREMAREILQSYQGGRVGYGNSCRSRIWPLFPPEVVIPRRWG